jgi:23S rRNA maturation mini-RNase III
VIFWIKVKQPSTCANNIKSLKSFMAKELYLSPNPNQNYHNPMAKKSSAVKALEKALENLRNQETTTPKRGRTSASESKEDTKRTDHLVKESRKFGDSLIAFYEEEKNRVQKFLDTINKIESGTYTPRRGGRRPNAGRKSE